MVSTEHMGKHQPRCNLAHALVNKLSVIVGSCDLMKGEMEENTVCSQRLETIRRVALDMAENLQHQQCQLGDLIREADKKPPSGSGSPRRTKKMA